MNKDNIWEQIIQFVEDGRWLFELSKYTRETDLENDLKLEGDDAYEFICLFGKEFNVNVSEFNFEEYFYPEGHWMILAKLYGLLSKQKEKKKITLGDLEKSVKDGKLV